MTQTFSRGSNGISRKSWGVMAAVVGLAIVLGLLNACSRVAPLLGGDEPPIRVRGGSMLIDLLTDGSADFEPDDPSDKKKWHIKDQPQRDRNNFLVVVVSTTCNGKVKSGNKVDIVYSDGQSVEFKSNSQHTRITALKDLDHPSGKLLKYEAAGQYVSAVKVDGADLCTFGAYDQTLQVFLLD